MGRMACTVQSLSACRLTSEYRKQSKHQPTHAPNKIKFVTTLKLLRIPESGCHLGGVLEQRNRPTRQYKQYTVRTGTLAMLNS